MIEKPCPYLLLSDEQRIILGGLVERLRACAIREQDRIRFATWWWVLQQCEHVLAGRVCSFFHSGDEAIEQARNLLAAP